VWNLEIGKEIASFCGDSDITCCAVKRGEKGEVFVNGSGRAKLADKIQLVIVAGAGIYLFYFSGHAC
jgi:hypothetical protein